MAEAYGDSRNDKPKTSSSRTKSSSSSGSKSSSSSSAGTAAENAAAKAKAKKVAELKKLAKTVEKTGTELEKTSNYLVEAMQDLKKGLTGASAAVINTITDTAQGAMETISNFLNSTGSKIASDLKSEGEQYAFGKSKVNVEKPTTKGNDVFSCDTDVLKGDVIPRLEKAQNTSGNASNEIAKAPKVQGYEGVSKEAEEINSVGTIISDIIGQLKDIVRNVEQKENENAGILTTIGNTFGKLTSNLLEPVVPKASAAEYVPPTTEQETGKAKEAEIKETMAKESSTDVARKEYLATRKFNQEQAKAEKNKQDTLPQTGALDRKPYNQQDYTDTPFGVGTIADNGCGITSLAEYLTRTRGQTITPEDIAALVADVKGSNQEKLEAAMEYYGLNNKIDNGGGKQERVLEALKNGHSALVSMNGNSKFTTAGHFMIFEGMTKDGKILVYDPYGDNYDKTDLKEGYKNGFDVKDALQGFGGFYDLEQNING